MRRRMFVLHTHMKNTLLYSKVKIFIASILIFMLCFCMTGCFYSENEAELNGINLDGAIVLRKPFSYDWNGSVPTSATNYYELYAGHLLQYLFNIYGVIGFDTKDPNVFAEIIRHDSAPDEEITALANAYAAAGSGAGASADEFIYFYDAIRYQITDVKVVTEAVDGEMITYKQVTAESNLSWNWSLPYNLPCDDVTYTTSAYVYDYVTGGIYSPIENSMTILNGRITNKIKENDFSFSQIQSYYQGEYDKFEDRQNQFNATSYSQKYLNDWDNVLENGEYTTALTYAIYSLVLGVKPNNITVSYDTATGRPTVSVEGFVATDKKSSVELALENIIALFNKLGSYVGLTARNKEAIAEYIIDDVIGANAYTYNSRMKYDAIVRAVVDYCSSLTRIGVTEGKDDDDSYRDDDIDRAFPASEIVFYPYGTFFVKATPDEGEDEFHGMPACEYQSVILMPSEATSVADIWLDFKYDAGRDGDEIYDPTKFLDITVLYRYYKGDGSEPLVKSMPIRVFDGPVRYGEDGSTLDVELDIPDMFGEALKIGKFAVPPAMDASQQENNTITLTGMTDARRYYKLVESSNGVSGYGVLNHTMFSDAYIEIAFDVQKKAGDNVTNYEFNVGLSNLFEPPTYPNDPVWH